MTVMTKSGVRLERREYERAWIALVAGVCATGVAAAALAGLAAGLMANCRGCVPEPGMVDAAVPGWQREQRAQMARRCAMMRAAWEAGVYGDELADQEVEQ